MDRREQAEWLDAQMYNLGPDWARQEEDIRRRAVEVARELARGSHQFNIAITRLDHRAPLGRGAETVQFFGSDFLHVGFSESVLLIEEVLRRVSRPRLPGGQKAS